MAVLVFVVLVITSPETFKWVSFYFLEIRMLRITFCINGINRALDLSTWFNEAYSTFGLDRKIPLWKNNGITEAKMACLLASKGEISVEGLRRSMEPHNKHTCNYCMAWYIGQPRCGFHQTILLASWFFRLVKVLVKRVIKGNAILECVCWRSKRFCSGWSLRSQVERKKSCKQYVMLQISSFKIESTKCCRILQK